MKTKKIVLSLTVFFSFAISNAAIENDVENLEKFFSQTPLQISSYSIKSFFKSNYSTLYDLTQYRSVKNTKMALFNESMSDYIKTIFNLEEYPNYISQNGAPVIDFLDLCNELNMDAEKAYSGLRLFYNKFKACEIIDDTVVNQLLDKIPMLLSRYFESTHHNDPFISLTENIKKILWAKFSNHFNVFENNTDYFFSDLSNDINKLSVNIFNQQEERKNENEIKERLKNTVIKIFELTISKMLWDYQRYESIWDSVLKIANGIERLAENHVISHVDDLDELFWSLIERFCIFLEYTGVALPIEFYENIETDLESRVVFFLEERELDDGITSKKERLVEALMRAKSLSIAAENGMLADPTVV